jgi:hypothetical protein
MRTRKKYAYHLRLFLEHFDFKSDTELLKNKDPKYHEGLIIQYIKTLSDRDMKHDTINKEVAPILHFYQINDVMSVAL